ncbi:hypothetical protein ACFRMQ_39415, partial [Kitasatospora sp. NPDC056783]|uniref:hypothetical protein n=1 Tax=Kitasatospora sp. NPDC056783 TaxID=3345943 RepID=UPI0036BDC20C
FDPVSVYAVAPAGNEDLQIVLRYPDGSTATLSYVRYYARVPMRLRCRHPATAPPPGCVPARDALPRSARSWSASPTGRSPGSPWPAPYSPSA